MKQYFEEVYGNKAFVYHRTKAENIDDIYKEGFRIIKKRSQDYYGTGIYANYKLESQLKLFGKEDPGMELAYGPVIIKSQVNTWGCLFFDYETAKLVFGSNYTLIDQLVKYKILTYNNIPDELKTMSKELETDPQTHQSIHAFNFIADYYKIASKTNGLFMYELREGHICVIYNEKIITPISFAKTIDNKFIDLENFNLKGEITFTNKNSKEAWESILNIKNFKKNLKEISTTYHKHNSKKDIRGSFHNFDN